MNDRNTETPILTEQLINAYQQQLTLDEYSRATIEKYIRDLRAFYHFLPPDKRLSKESTIAYKRKLEQHYAVRSTNSMLVSINRFFKHMGAGQFCVKLFRLQRNAFCDKEKELSKEEYFRLVREARQQGNERLSMIIQTICSTGIRVSELKYIDVPSLKKGYVQVSCKNKIRTIFLPKQLCHALSSYCKKNTIRDGSIFVSRTGNPLDRSNIWRAMKQLCEGCGISPQKVFPHNLRHLFAITFYNMKKDIVRLADILGHASVETTRLYTITSKNGQSHLLSKMNLCCFDSIKAT